MKTPSHAVHTLGRVPSAFIPLFPRRAAILCCIACVAAVCAAGCTPPERRVPSPAQQAAWQKARLGPGICHTVQPGDTLVGIANLYDASISRICRANSLKSMDKIYPGQQVFVPDATEAKGERLELIKDADAPAETADPKNPKLPEQPVKAEIVFVRPLDGPIIKGFGADTLVGANPGIDIGGAAYMPVVAAKSGIVREVVSKSGIWGKVIIIDHGDAEKTLYARIGDALVSPGDHVKQGQVIGKLADPGPDAKASLHFRIYKGADPVDPARKLAMH